MRKLVPSKKCGIIALLMFFSALSSGCVYLVIGGIAAVGGYVVSPDTIQGETERAYDEVWEASLEIATIMGRIDYKSDKIGEISAIINNAKVKIEVSQLTPSLVRLKVRSRKALFPNIETAQEVYVKIMRRLDEEFVE